MDGGKAVGYCRPPAEGTAFTLAQLAHLHTPPADGHSLVANERARGGWSGRSEETHDGVSLAAEKEFLPELIVCCQVRDHLHKGLHAYVGTYRRTHTYRCVCVCVLNE